MATLLNPATGKYLLNPAPEHLHDEVIQWISDLEFFKTELLFIGKLLDKAFLRITSSKNLNELKVLEVKIKSLHDDILEELHKQLILHERDLSRLDMDMFKVKMKIVEEEHKKLNTRFQNFTSQIKQLKKEVFNLVEKQLVLVKKVKKDFEEGNLAL